MEAFSKRVETIKRESKIFQQPENVALLAKLQAYLNEQALVGKSQSLSDIVKVVNRELRSGQDKDYVLPTTQAAIAQTLLQYQSSHRPQNLWHFVTPDYQKTLVWLQLTSGDNQDMTQVIKLVDDYFAQNPLPEGLRYQWAGKAYLNVVWQENMVAGMLESLLSAFIIVFLMMVVLFRSLVFGVLAMLPLTITITFIYGAIGIVGKDYDMPIAVLSALTLGLSVDFAIHFWQGQRNIQRNGQCKRHLKRYVRRAGKCDYSKCVGYCAWIHATTTGATGTLHHGGRFPRQYYVYFGAGHLVGVTRGHDHV